MPVMAFVALGEAVAGMVSNTVVATQGTKTASLLTEAEKIKAAASSKTMLSLIVIIAMVGGIILFIFKRKKKRK
jgi:LPXTG-motif cell wall-anchored protein